MPAMNPTTHRLKRELWQLFGTRDHPAEWDGLYYGGGKLSQRHWEYFIGVELLDLTPDSVVLDIGGGSPATGSGFFASLLSSAVKKVIIVDPNITPHTKPAANAEFVREAGDYASLERLLQAHPEITHVASISTFEHIAPEVREGIVRAINDYFTGESFVATFEYHPVQCFFEHQLTARSVSSLFSPLVRYYLDEFRSAPVYCENAFDRARLLRLQRPPFAPRNFAPGHIPLWYPVATRFLRAFPTGQVPGN